jgi:SH2 domain/Protein tyrosine and serine/threonine kinase
VWQIVTRKEPYQHHTDFRRFRLAVCRRHERPPIPDDCPKSLSSLIQRCWAADESERPTFKDITVALEHILLETLVPEEDVRTFWAQHFLIPKRELQEVVPWSEFVQRLYLSLNPPAGAGEPADKITFHKDTFNKLKGVLATANLADKYVVNVRRFQQLCIWFGPFFRPGLEGYNILDELRQVVDREWFHDDITKEEAERRLAPQETGTFLVRVSSSVPEYPFTISMAGNQHRRIQHAPGGDYSFKGHSTRYTTLLELIENCKDPKIAAQLATPCPREVEGGLWGYS